MALLGGGFYEKATFRDPTFIGGEEFYTATFRDPPEAKLLHRILPKKEDL